MSSIIERKKERKNPSHDHSARSAAAAATRLDDVRVAELRERVRLGRERAHAVGGGPAARARQPLRGDELGAVACGEDVRGRAEADHLVQLEGRQRPRGTQ